MGNAAVDRAPVPSASRVAKLIMVSEENNNKFYEMTGNADGTFTARFGRVGSRPQERRYAMGEWEAKYGEKLRKGYRDVTALFAEASAQEELEIADHRVRELIRALTRYADRSIAANYLVVADQVAPQQVAEAQALLDELTRSARVGVAPEAVNRLLLELYRVIPRRMKQVADGLVTALATPDDVHRLEVRLAEEQATLDVLAGQVRQRERVRASGSPAQRPGLLDAMGLSVTPVDDPAEIDRIKAQMGDEAGLFARAYAVVNTRTEAAFQAHVSQRRDRATALLWHGSRNENWLSILQSGLVLHPANAVVTGKMFGYGLYFADRCRKSLGYTSLRGSFWAAGRERRGFLALYEVHTGAAWHIRKHAPWCCALDATKLQGRGLLRGLLRRGYDSVFAERGADLLNNEYIVYHAAQCTVRYLVEVGA